MASGSEAAVKIGERVLSLALSYSCLPLELALVARRACRETNRAFLYSIQARRCCLTLNGASNFKTPAHIATLLNSALPCFRIRFIGLSLVDFFLSDPIHFRTFVRKYDGEAAGLNSLHIIRCNLSMGRFIELVAFLSLSDLRIVDSPSLLQSDMQIAHFAHVIPVFARQFGNLRSFELVSEKVTQENQTELLALVSHYSTYARLHRLRLSTKASPLCKEAIGACLRANGRSLKSLHLDGYIELDKKFVEESLSSLKLRHLALSGTRIVDAAAMQAFHADFVCGQSRLRSLTLRSVWLLPCFHMWLSLNSLQDVEFVDCVFPPESQDLHEFWSSLSRVPMIQTVSIGFSKPDSGQALAFDTTALKSSLFGGPPLPSLIALELVNIKSVLFMQDVAKHCRNLRSLILDGCCLPSAQMKYVYCMTMLEALTVKACDLKSENFVKKQIIRFEEASPELKVALTGLQRLTYLDMSHNPELNVAAFFDIRRLENLETLNLEGTQMEKRVLDFLIRCLFRNGRGRHPQEQRAPIKLANLKEVKLEGCRDCVLTSKAYRTLAALIYPLKISVDLLQ